MRVLQILPELNVGGVETGTVDFAKYLISKGHQSFVVSSGGRLVADLEKAGSKHFFLSVQKKSLWSAIKSINALKKIILQEKIDIVHARSRVPAWIAFFACRSTGAAFITTCHGYYSNHFLSRVMGWSKLVIVPSQVIGRHMSDEFQVFPQNLRLIPRSVDLERFSVPRKEHSSPENFVVSIVGRITPLKGHIYFLKAMAKVVRAFPSIRIWIIGDCPAKKESYKRELEMTIKHLGLSRHVEFLGNRRDIPELLAQTDVSVLSTVTQEAFGRVILESQVAGAAVVATSVGGVVEIIEHEKTGLLVPPKNPEAMADSVMRILNDPALKERLVSAGQKKVREKYTLAHQCDATIKVYQELLKSLNILVIKLSSIGDVILITASLRALRQKFPNATIHCLVGEKAKDVLKDCPYVDELIVFDEILYKGFKGIWSLAGRLRRYKFDRVIDFQNNRKSHLLSALTFPIKSYGYNNKKLGFLLTDSIKDFKEKMSPVEHQFKVLQMLDISYQPEASLELWPSAKDEKYVQSLLDSQWLGNVSNFVGINISASVKWETKNWPVGYMAKLCDLLAAKNIRVVVTGMEKDKALGRQLLSLSKTKPANLIGQTNILQLAALIGKCKVFVTPDSAPMHVAAAVGTPFVSLFGPTDPARHLPPSKNCAVLNKSLSCSPCYSSKCRIETHACLKEISAEDVAKEVFKLMKVSK